MWFMKDSQSAEENYYGHNSQKHFNRCALEIKVPARGKTLVPTDLGIAVPEGTYARIAHRSGLAWKHAIDVGSGVINADYRGPVGVILFNHSDVGFEVKTGDRIAQLIIEK
ncbi:Deoxyuridine 5'-triphosphate nucleotidohydrolase [Heracleum sosnowskyi]|uniref:Deoxyuridine 5'-triphosphate nucleotidohydrolase n=1 Tax=Heracleum sosnowskyi TaxID=360622 RepID=A0AAD8J0W6_9APIA|nr:Deoxyuridine 5'-triphosphate nucleotidohydrolase [Heracleum sosnowskyi]